VDQQELLENLRGNEIAIVGMSGRFPGASDIQTFWQNLVDEVCSIVFFTDEELLEAGVSPETLQDPLYVKAGGPLEDVECFDAGFFGYSPREAEIIDPQQRLLVAGMAEVIEERQASLAFK
jgi:acyl transferase domain-containing protein